MTEKNEASEGESAQATVAAQTVAPPTTSTDGSGGRDSSSRGAIMVAGVALVVAIAACAASAILWQRSDALSREVAQRLRQGDDRVTGLEGRIRQSQEGLRELQGRSAILEGKLGDAIGQQSQLEQLYRAIAQDSLAAALSEVENSIAFAAQQLAVSGNVSGALIAMEDADTRLKRIDQPQALGLRRLIAADIQRLTAVPNVDVVGLALRLDSVSTNLSQLPLKAALGSASRDVSQAGAAASEGAGFSFARLAQASREGWRALLAEISQLFRVSRVDQPEVLLLAPEQQYFVRENLRLRLLSARIALLARNEQVFKSDLAAAVSAMHKYYDEDNRGVASAISALEQIRGNSITTELPSLGDTLAAVRAARVARDEKR